MAVRLSALRADRPLPQGTFLVLISVRGWVDPRSIVRLEGLGQLKNPMTSSGIEPACSIAPQPTTLPHAPTVIHYAYSLWNSFCDEHVISIDFRLIKQQQSLLG
jgi:hypothetical protein